MEMDDESTDEASLTSASFEQEQEPMAIGEPLEPWFEEFASRLSISSNSGHTRKRKADRLAGSDSDSDEPPTTSDSVSSAISKFVKHNEDDSVCNSRKDWGTKEEVVCLLMKYLSDEERRNVRVVSRVWCQSADFALLNSHGPHPFLRLWISRGPFRRFSLHQLVRSVESGPHEIQAAFFGATAILEESKLSKLDFVRTNQLKNMSYTAGFADRLITTTPDYVSTGEFYGDGNNNAFLALFVPTSDRLCIRGFSVPASAEHLVTEEIFDVSSKFTEAFRAPKGYTLKGLTLLQYQNDSLVTNLIVSRLSSENQTIPLVGGILTSVMCPETYPDANFNHCFPLAAGWAIFGNDSVRVWSVVLSPSVHPVQDAIFAQIHLYFAGVTDGFILLFYKSSPIECGEILAKLRTVVGRYIPIVGIHTKNLCFQGSVIVGNYASEMKFPNNEQEIEPVNMICLLVAY